MLCLAAFWGPHLSQVDEIDTHVFERLNLLVQVVTLQEVTQVDVILVHGQLSQPAVFGLYSSPDGRCTLGFQATLPVLVE